jgi:hypothetical protein
MDNFTSSEWQTLIIAIINQSYAPFATAYVCIWALAIAQRIFGGLV